MTIDGILDEPAWPDVPPLVRFPLWTVLNSTGRLDFNERLRYAFAEGTDLWPVY